MKTFRRLLSYARPVGWLIPQYIVYTLLFAIFNVVNFVILVPVLKLLFNIDQADLSASTEGGNGVDMFYGFLNDLIEGRDTADALLVICAVLIVSVILANLFNYLSLMLQAKARVRAVTNLRNDVFNKVTNLDMAYFTETQKGGIMTKVTSDVQQVETTVVNSLRVLFKEPFMVIAYFYFLFSTSLELTLYTLLLIPVAGGLIGYLAKRLKKRAKNAQESLGRMTSILEETLSGMRVIKAFTAKWYTQEKFSNETKYYAHQSYRIASKFNLSAPISQILGTIMLCVILIIGGNMVLDGDKSISAEEFIVFLIAFGQVIVPAKNIANAFTHIQRGIVSGNRVFDLIDTPMAINETDNATEISHINEKITFDSVDFAYEERNVLNAINFEIGKGKTVALVGPSGGGKSTIADLIPRFYDPTQGTIQIDGRDIREYKIESLRKLMGIVTQESILFNDSIHANIAFGRPEASREEVINAATVANAHEFIEKLDDGYDTLVGERGTKLSGGQRQRLSIARAVLKDPEILILDEATSALDSESEKLVQDAIYNLTQNRTTLVIAHRLSTIQNADEIIVVKEGEIVQRGSHEELLETGGMYKKLLEIQNVPGK